MRRRSSSPLRSLQQVPRSCTPHLLVNGWSPSNIPSSCCCRVVCEGGSSRDQTGSLVLPDLLRGRATALVVEVEAEDADAFLQHPFGLPQHEESVGDIVHDINSCKDEGPRSSTKRTYKPRVANWKKQNHFLPTVALEIPNRSLDAHDLASLATSILCLTTPTHQSA